MLYQFVVLYFAVYLAHSVSVLAYFATGRVFGIQVHEISIGLARLFRRGKLRMGLLPVSAYVRFADSREDEEEPDPRVAFDGKPRWMRMAVQLSACSALLLLAFVLRGADAWHSFVNGFGQIINGTLAPPTRGADLLASYAQLAVDAGPIAATGVVAAKFAAFNLLPLPILAGGQALVTLLFPIRSEGWTEKLLTRLQQIGITIALVFYATWLWALVALLSR